MLEGASFHDATHCNAGQRKTEMLQPDAFCEHTMQQNATAANAPPRTLLGELTALPDALAGSKGKEKGKEEK